ncbi:heme NO-binding domain-containing protein [Chlamydiales bacterium]|nr:heme NO-binding domain-containing protein [Chlamydiales bacterium]
MQGFVFTEFQEFVRHNYGTKTWDQIAKKLDIKDKNYSLFQTYPTEDFENVIKELSSIIDKPYYDIMEELGEFSAPKIWKFCKWMIPPKWTLSNLLENVTGLTSNLLAHIISGTEAPPKMRCTVKGENEVTIHYYSARKMCAFGKGIVRGISKYYDCTVTITEPKCLLRGDAECEIIFTITPLQ